MDTRIRHMHITTAALEQIQLQAEAATYAALPEDRARSHYWYMEKKVKKGKKTEWKFMRGSYFWATKAEAADRFQKFYKPGEHRLRKTTVTY